MTVVSKSELARHLGVKPPMITKYVKKGLLDKCFDPTGKKLILEKALEVIEKSRVRDPKNENINNSFIEAVTPIDVKNDDNVYTDESVHNLAALLLETTSSSQKVQVTKDFWLGRINRQKFLKEERELINVDDAKAAIDALLTPLNKALDDLPITLKAHHPDITSEVVEWLIDHVNDLKVGLKNTSWEL